MNKITTGTIFFDKKHLEYPIYIYYYNKLLDIGFTQTPARYHFKCSQKKSDFTKDYYKTTIFNEVNPISDHIKALKGLARYR